MEVVEGLWFAYLELWSNDARYPIVQCFTKNYALNAYRAYDEVQRPEKGESRGKRDRKRRESARAILTNVLGEETVPSEWECR